MKPRIVLTILFVILTSMEMAVSLRRIEKIAALALMANAGVFGGGAPKYIPVPVYVGGGEKGKGKEQKVLQPIIISGCGAGQHGQFPLIGGHGHGLGGSGVVW